jgi:cell division protein FtsB
MAHGIDLAAMQVKLLQKIEELTLHQIAQEKRLNAQADRIKALETENRHLREATQF